jgi:hypothetical protein
MTAWMINCKEYSALVSKELDWQLSFWERVSLKMHGWICPACHHVKKQLDTIRQACRIAPSEVSCEEDPSCTLPDDACSRIKAALKNLQKNNGH